jgi:CRP-like cAMP-binding protein
MKDLPNIEKTIQLISNTYSSLTDDTMAEFEREARIVSMGKSTLLVKEGQYADKLYFIIKGGARVFYIKEDRDITDWFAFENEFLISDNSFFQRAPSLHYIELIEPTTLLEISRDDILKISNKRHDFCKLGGIIITKIMLQSKNRIASIQFESAQQKYENLISMRKDIIQRVPLTHIASYLGITLETLSRVRHPKKRI